MVPIYRIVDEKGAVLRGLFESFYSDLFSFFISVEVGFLTNIVVSQMAVNHKSMKCIGFVFLVYQIQTKE